MDVYKLEKLGIKVGMFGNETTFLDVLNGLVKIDPRLGIDNVEDLVNALSKSGYDDDMGKDLCLDELDGVDADDDDFETEWGDEMYDRAAGKQVSFVKKNKELIINNQQYNVSFQSADIDFPDRKKIEEQVKQLEDRYSNVVIKPDDYKWACDIKAEINKFKSSLVKQKNEVIKEADRPVNEFNKEINDFAKRLAKVYKNLNDQTKVFDEKKRSARKDLRLKQIQKMCEEAGLEIDPSEFPYDSKWSNTNVSEKVFEFAVNQEISLLLEKKKYHQDNLTAITKMASELGLSADPFIQLFEDGHDLNTVMNLMGKEQKEIAMNVAKKIAAKHEEQMRMKQTESKAYDPETGEIKGDVFNFKLSFSATKEQVRQLNEFLRQNNISAKRVK